ncbi:MAG: DNA mismatch repair protein MutS [Proteiniphilum sp.]|uniref:MutS-related protein n=1 Tax=Proteiniphilum sp. TaxID=1926877 RepID=UPI002B1F22DC|nr:DNA mismatch repair protein MutS [Proteiniphilum sp.]MEA5126602.1 DNA mismatch repair protein MutS [Proteiniphilum sp.]
MSKQKKYLNLKRDWGKLKGEDFDFDLIEKFSKKKDNNAFFQVIPDKTEKDIDFQELFMFLDRTNSKIGQQYFYNKLRVIDTQYNFADQEKLVSYFLDNEPQRVESQLLLSKLNNRDSYYISSLFQEEYIERPKWFWAIITFSIVNIVLLILTLFYSQIIIILIINFFISAFFHYWNKKNIYYYANSIPQLLPLLNAVRYCLNNHFDEVVHNSLKSLERLKGRISLFSSESKSDSSEIVAIVLTLLEYIKIFFLVEPILVFNALKKLKSKKSDIQNLFEFIGSIDTAISIASLRTGLDYYCKPSTSKNSMKLDFENIYHPLIINCVPNSLKIEDKSILLTGSNMSGKTTFIRTVAINVLCAQTINTCFANQFMLSQPTRLYSTIRITDDLLNDKSYYFEEVLTIKQLINNSESNHQNLFLLDEVFKGTNTLERIAAGKAVLSYLSRGRNIVLVSTHDIELTELLNEKYELYHFNETVHDNEIYFDYKIKKGILTTRNAINILKLNGYPDELINDAKNIARLLQS